MNNCMSTKSRRNGKINRNVQSPKTKLVRNKKINIPNTSSETDLLILKVSTNKTPWSDGSTTEFYLSENIVNSYPSQTVSKFQRNEYVQTHPMRLESSWYQPNKSPKKKKITDQHHW